MGVWGPGTFDGDSPRDFLADMVGHWEQMAETVLARGRPAEATAFDFAPGLETGEGCLMPTVEIIIAVAEKLEPDYLPTVETVTRWSEQYLRWFDEEIDAWEPSPGFKAERRGVIAETFQRLLRLVRSRPGGDGSGAPVGRE